MMNSTKKEIGPRGKKLRPAAFRLSRLHKPDYLTLEAWQVALRKQFGREQKFKLENVGDHAVFSDFQVTNPQSKHSYRVVIPGGGLADNFCSCPDFATNTPGTCSPRSEHFLSASKKIEHDLRCHEDVVGFVAEQPLRKECQVLYPRGERTAVVSAKERTATPHASRQ